VAGYDIRCHTDPITAALWDVATQCPNPPAPLSAGSAQEYIATGLFAETTYYFAVKSYDEEPNWSPLSNIATGTTLASADTTPPAAIIDLAASAQSANAIKLTWTSPGDDGTSGTATGYYIRYSTVTITDSNWATALQVSNPPVPQSANSPETFTVTSLFASQTYYFAIKTYDEKPNLSDLSNIADDATFSSEDAIEPAAITDLAVTDATESSISLTWTAPGDDGNTDTATAYDIRYAEVSVTELGWPTAIKVLNPPVPAAPGTTEIFLVTGLSPSTTYYFAIKTADEKPNWSPISNSPSGKTLGTALPELAVTVTPERTTLTSQETFDLTIDVKAKSGLTPLEQASITLSSDNTGLAFQAGTGESGSDGTFSTIVSTPEVTASTVITIFADVTMLNYKSARAWTTITVQPLTSDLKFNLVITETDIAITPSSIKDGDEVTITALITNDGERFATKFIVKFYIDDVQHGDDSVVDSLEVDGTTTLDKLWLATEGAHTIKISIIPWDPDLESDSTDNEAERSVTVDKKDTGGDGKDPTDTEKKGDDKGAQTTLYIAIVVVAIIAVVLLVMAMMMKKKKKTEEVPPAAAPPVQAPAVPGVPGEAVPGQEMPAAFDPNAFQVPEGQQLPSFEPQQPEGMYTDYAGVTPDQEEMVEVPPDQAEQPAIAPPEGQPPAELPPAPPTDAPPAEAPPVAPPAAPPAAPAAGVAGQVAKPQPPQEVQQVPCPGCSNLITPYSSPCPHCGMNLNWS
jgi:hypothetical protein